MCDYYEFSNTLYNFLYESKHKKYKSNKPEVLYNIEVYGLSKIEIIIFTQDELLFEYTKNKLISKETELRKIIRKQLYIYQDAKIVYTHAPNIDVFEDERDRNAEIDYIVKYYR